MKKRILSMLLLVAMIVTALPLVAISAFATQPAPEEPDFTAEDYNALYVQDDLVYAIDFFSTNAFWGGASQAYTDADALRAGIASFTWRGSMSFSSIKFAAANPTVTVANGFLEMSGLTELNAASVGSLTKFGYAETGGATAEYVKVLKKQGQQILFNDVRTEVSAEGKVTNIGVRSIGSMGPTIIAAPKNAEGGDVYLRMISDPTTFAIVMSRPKPTLSQTSSDVNAQDVRVASYMTDENGEQVITVTSAKIGNLLYWPGGTETVSAQYVDGVAQAAPAEYEVVWMHNRVQNGYYALYENGNALYENAEAPYINNASLVDGCYWRWSTTQSSLHAARYYARALSAAELANNHAIDILKFYKLNLNYWTVLSDENRAAVAAALAAYDCVNTAEARAVVAEAFETAAIEAAAKQFEELRSSEMIDAAVAYGLDASRLLILPVQYMRNAYDFVWRLTQGEVIPEAGQTVAEAFDAAVDADIAAYCAAAPSDKNWYNDLYVDGAVLQLDFFGTNEYWGEPWAKGGIDGNDGATVVNVMNLLTPYTIQMATGVSFGGGGTPTAAIADGYLKLGNTSTSNYIQVTLTNNAPLAKTDYDYSIEQVLKFESSKLTGNQFYLRNHWFSTNGSSYSEATGATLKFANLQASIDRWSDSDGKWGAYWTPIHAFSSAPTYVAGHRAATLSFVFQIEEYRKSSTTPVTGEKPAFALYVPEQNDPVFAVTAMSGGTRLYTDKSLRTATATSGVYTYDTETDPGHFGFTDYPFDTTANDRIGYNGFDGRVYAIRYYGRALTQTEVKQNHFADVAKFFRLNLDGIEHLDDMAALCDAVADIDLATSTRFEAQLAVSAVLSPCLREAYAESCETYANRLTARQMDILTLYGLDPKPLATLPDGILLKTLAALSDLAADRDYLNAAARYRAALLADLATVEMGSMTAEQYNDLYVRRGLYYALDFFETNEYWNSDFVMPTAPADMTAYEYGGEIYNFKENLSHRVAHWAIIEKTGSHWGVFAYCEGKEYDSYAAAAEALRQMAAADSAVAIGTTHRVAVKWTDAFAAAISDYTAKVNASNAKSDFSRFEDADAAAASTMSLLATLPMVYVDIGDGSVEAGLLQRSAFIIENGYARFVGVNTHTENYMNFTGASTSHLTDAVTQQVVIETGADFGNSALIFWNIRLAGNKTAVGLSVTGFSGFSAASFPSVKPIVPADGKANTLSYELLGRKSATAAGAPGTVSLRLGTKSLFSLKGTYTDGQNSTNLIGYGNAAMKSKVYAYRQYTVALTDDEVRQNHFADLVKFFRIDVTAYELLDGEARARVHAAVEGLDLATSTREAVLEAYLGAVQTELLSTYNKIAAENPSLPAALVLTAAEYHIDLATLLASGRDMSALADSLTLDGLHGKTMAEAAAIYRELYHDAYYYLSYARDGEEAWNGFLTDLAELDIHLATEALMALPWAVRKEVTSLELTQEAIDAFVEKAMEAYTDYEVEAVSYDDLYVTDGLVFAADFFKTNKYWNTEGIDYSLPLAPALDPTYWKDKNGDGIPNTGEINANGWTGSAYTTEFNNAYAKWRSDEQAWLKQFETLVDTNIYAYSWYISSQSEALAAKAYGFFTQEDGYIRIRTDGYGSGGLQLAGIGNYIDNDVTQQLVLTPMETLKSNFTIFYNVRPTVSYSGTELKITNVTDGMKNVTVNESKQIPLDGAIDFTLGLHMDTVYTDTEVKEGASSPAVVTVSTEDGSFAKFTGTYSRNDAMYVGWSNTTDLKLYAWRQYDRALTQEEIRQNHFADLAKFFRLNLAPYALLTEAEKAEVQEALHGFNLETSTREEVLAAYMNVVDAHYAAAAEALDASLVAVAKEVGLDLTSLLAIREEESRALIASAVTDEFSVGYSMNATVVRGELAKAMTFLGSIDFLGVQVRLATGNENDEMPGVRSLFEIDRNALCAVLASGKEVTLGATVAIGENEYTIYFNPTLEGGELRFDEQSGKLTEIELPDGKSIFGFAYTVVFSGWESYDEATAHALYNTEFDYSFFVSVDGVRYTRDVTYSQFENGTVSAYKAYSYLYDEAEHAGDKIFKEVLTKGETK